MASSAFNCEAEPITLKNPTATLSQTSGWNVSLVTDGTTNDYAGWAIFDFGDGTAAAETAVFETEVNVGYASGTALTFVLYNVNHNPQASLGRFRLSYTRDSRDSFANGANSGGDVTADWTILVPELATATAGTTLTILEDGSVLASGNNPDKSIYTLVAKTTATDITGFRLEALEDPSLPSSGPGRSPNGNFVLTEMTVDAAPTGPHAPHIFAAPQSQTVTRGNTVAFSVGASGSAPLSYQWLFNQNPIEGANTSTLTINNVQLVHAGNYAVVVSNELGTATSADAALIVNLPPATVRVVNANGTGAAEMGVSVELFANGNENAVGFSLNFDARVLEVVGTTLGVGTPSGAVLLLNTNDVAAGRLGLVVGLPANEVFSEGTQQVALVTFLVAPILNQTNVPVSFGDQPTRRELSDVHAHLLPAAFVGGSISIADSQFEGDVAPRPTSDRSVTTIDWVQMGRFVARLETISNTNEYQRADCAPRATKGNGLVTVSDWVQAGRYAVGLDPLTVLGGPIEMEGGEEGGFAAASASQRLLSVVNSSIPQGQTNTVSITLECQGNENAASFSLVFDPGMLSFVTAAPGSGTPGALLNLNTSEVAEGRLGIALAAQPGKTLAAGIREILQISFSAQLTASATAALSFGNAPVPHEISDVVANPLPTHYADGTISIPPPGPRLRFNRSGDLFFISWPSSATGFQLESTQGGLGTAWSLVPGVIDFGDQRVVAVTLGSGERYFRLKKL